MIKRIFATMMSLCLLLGLMPTVALAEGESAAPTPEYVAWIGEKGYETLEAAVTAAKSGDTITLGEGKYTLYKKGAVTLGKDLTFVGQGIRQPGVLEQPFQIQICSARSITVIIASMVPEPLPSRI